MFIKFQGNNETTEKSEKKKSDDDMVELIEYKNEGRPEIIAFDGIGDFGLKFGLHLVQWCPVGKDGVIIRKGRPTLNVVWNVGRGKNGKSWIDHSGKWFPWDGKCKGQDIGDILALLGKLDAKAKADEDYRVLMADYKAVWEPRQVPKKAAQPSNPALVQGWRTTVQPVKPVQIREPEETTTPTEVEIPDLTPQTAKPVRRNQR